MPREESDDGDSRTRKQQQQQHRQAEWPVFGRAERQRASDERRSHTRSRHDGAQLSRAATNMQGVGGTTPHGMFQQATACPNGSRQGDPWLHHHQHSKHVRGNAVRRVAENHRHGPGGTTARARPASGSAAGRGNGRDSTMSPKLSRKRPVSADIVREHDGREPGRVHNNTYDPTVVGPTWQQQQPPRKVCGIETQAPTEVLRRISGPEAAAAARAEGGCQPWRRLSNHSVRPKSAYPRLEDGGGRPGDCLVVGAGVGVSGRNDGNSSSRVGRIRSLSARTLKCSASAPSQSTPTPRSSGRDRDGRSSMQEGSGQYVTTAREGGEVGGAGGRGGVEEEEEEGKEEEEEEEQEGITRTPTLRQNRSSVRTTATKRSSRPHSEAGHATPGSVIGQSSGERKYSVPASASATEGDSSRRRTSSVEVPKASPPASATGSLGQPTQAAAPRAAAAPSAKTSTNSKRVIARSSPSRSRKRDSPSGGGRPRKPSPVTSKGQHRRDGCDARRENGRDGKLYLSDPGSDERRRQEPNDDAQRFDNGRDGKLYVELDNGRDGKLYLEPGHEDDDDDVRPSLGKSRAARPLEATAKRRGAVESTGERSGGGLEKDIAGTAEESTERRGTGESSQTKRRADAAKIIQRAMASTVVRRRSSRGVDESEETAKADPENLVRSQTRDDFGILSERKGGGRPPTGEEGSTDGVAAERSEVRGAFVCLLFCTTMMMRRLPEIPLDTLRNLRRRDSIHCGQEYGYRPFIDPSRNRQKAQRRRATLPQRAWLLGKRSRRSAEGARARP